MKKLLSLFMVLCIICAQIPTVIAADDAISTEQAVRALADLGLMNGDENGDLKGDKRVTRAEFVTLLSRMISDYAPVAKNSFSDVDASHWAAECIGYFTDRGVINGYDDGRFGPSDSVNLSQAVKMILEVLDLADDSFVYPDDYLLTGAKSGLTVGVDVKPEANLDRNETAALLLNALYTKAKDGSMMIDNVDKKLYYVSPNGSDSADGSYAAPWQTLGKAAESVSGEAIVYLAEGEYAESSATVFANGGESAEKPLVVKASFGAEVKISYSESDDAKIKVLEGADNVIIKNITFTATPSETTDEEICTAFVKISANGFGFVHNTVMDADCAVEIENGENAFVTNNTFNGGRHAIEMKNTLNTKVSDNTLNSQTETAIAVCGGSKNAQIYNNKINAAKELSKAAIALGDDAGAYNCVLWNNIIYADDDMTAPGLVYTNTVDCHFYNNIVNGMAGGIVFEEKNTKPVMRNNIFAECGGLAYIFNGDETNIDSDYNCFNEAYPEIKEKNSKFANPYFISKGVNWKLISFSPARETGIAISPEIVGYGGEKMLLDFSDIEGDDRGDVWSMGVYSTASKVDVEENITEDMLKEERKPFLELDFEDGVGKFLNNGGAWEAIDGVYHQTSVSAASYRTVYEGGEAWENYEVSIDIKSPSAISGNASGLLFRCDTEMENMYSLRYLANNQIEFVRWLDNTFGRIKVWEYSYEPETFYNFKVKANGNTFTFYINDELLGEVVDDTFDSGSVGCYSYREPNEYDNIKIYTIQ